MHFCINLSPIVFPALPYCPPLQPWLWVSHLDLSNNLDIRQLVIVPALDREEGGSSSREGNGEDNIRAQSGVCSGDN